MMSFIEHLDKAILKASEQFVAVLSKDEEKICTKTDYSVRRKI